MDFLLALRFDFITRFAAAKNQKPWSIAQSTGEIWYTTLTEEAARANFRAHSFLSCCPAASLFPAHRAEFAILV